MIMYCECGGKMHPLNCSEEEFMEIVHMSGLTWKQWEFSREYYVVNKSCPYLANELETQEIVGEVGNVYLLKWRTS